MSQHSRRRIPNSFPFADLPADLQHLVLGNVDIHTLKSMMKSIPGMRELYMEYPLSILQGTAATMGLQIRNLLLTTERLVTTIRAENTDSKPILDDMEVFLSDTLDTEAPWKILSKRSDALSALQTMCNIDTEITGLVQDYAKDIYERACHRYNQDAIPPLLVLSRTETHRLTRAFYRLKLFGVLFYNYADRFCINLYPSYKVFFARLSAFEIDEMNTAYQWAIREGRYFTPAWPHSGCSFAKRRPRTKKDPFNCWKCGGKFDSMMVIDGCIRPRAIQPFWCTLEKHFIYMGRWADSARCRPLPVKQWDDIPETNKPSAGWALWRKYHGRVGEGSLDEYVNGFRALGYCFWDGARLEGWGNMFSRKWLDDEGSWCSHHGCLICPTYGSRTCSW